MAHKFPISLHSVANLVEKGINKDACKFGSLSLEGTNHLAVKDVGADGSPQLALVYLTEDVNVTRKPMKAEAAIMHPVDNIIALKAKGEAGGHNVQVFDFDTKGKLGTYTFQESVVLWKWVDSRVLGIVTDKSVYHWKVDGKGEAEKIFDRTGKLAEVGVQLMNYIVDPQMKWCVLSGLSKDADSNNISGTIQLYSIEKKQQRLLPSHASCFGEIMMDKATSVFCYTEASKDPTTTKLYVMDIFSTPDGETTPFRVVGDIEFGPEQANDFPVTMHISKKYGVIFLITKNGYIYIFDAQTATQLFKHRISQQMIFASAYNEKDGGIYAVNRAGLILSVTINEQTFIPFIQSDLSHIPNAQDIAFSFAKHYGLPGADDLLVQVFSQHFAKAEYAAAARIVGFMKSGALRNAQIIERFKTAPVVPGQPSPILTYFQTLLGIGKLNALESKEIATPLVAQGKREFIELWLKEDKLECTEELGDIIRPMDGKLALSIYLRANAPGKVVQSLVEQGQYEQIVSYCNKVNYQADFTNVLRSIVHLNPDGTHAFCKKLLDNDPPLVDINQVVDILTQQGKLQEITSILLDFLKHDRADQGYLQTRLLELNLLNAPQVAEAIFQMDKYTQFDKPKIAALCEKAGLYQRALEYYADVNDVKRIIAQTGSQFSLDWMQQFFSKMAPAASLEILADMLRTNRQNLNTVVSMAIKFHDSIGATNLIQMFESFSSYEGIFYFLGSVLSFSQDPVVHFKYIEAAAKLNHSQEVERCCRESKYYDPVQVKDFLKESKFSDPRPLIYVCDLHNFVDEMTEYLYKQGLMKYIEVYVSKVNPQNTPTVLATLIDMDCPEDFIKNLLGTVRGMCPVVPLVQEMEKRNRLRVLLPWLEARMNEGNQEAELHNAIAKICIDTHKDPEAFLKNNAFYDSKVVGKYCEDRDPHLAFAAYKRAWGSCDAELIDLTNSNGLFRLQARYLVERRSSELWLAVLSNDSEYRRSVIDQVVSTALPESTSSEEVSVAVKAFTDAKLPLELIELLERIVLHNSGFSSNKNLQNLLILTAIKAQPNKVMDYINRLDNFDSARIARYASEEGLHEEAFQIYNKSKMVNEAMDMLLKGSDGLTKAIDYANRCSEPSLWSKVAEQQLTLNLVDSAIESYLKAGDGSNYKAVLNSIASEQSDYTLLIAYLKMARKTTKDQLIDTELLYGLAKDGHLKEMEEFIEGSSTANIQQIGDRIFGEGLYEAAKKLYATIPNYAKMAICFVRLNEYGMAIEAAKKANSPKTWKEISFACVEAKEYKCAHVAGLALIVHPDHLDELIMQYEYRGLFDDLISLLEAGIMSDRTHIGMFTELGVLYAKFKGEKLMEFCRSHCGKLNISKVIRACERYLHWKVAIFLHMYYGEYDQAAQLMMGHNSVAWDSEEFSKIMLKVSNQDLYYQAINFYLTYYPLELPHFLKSIQDVLDHAKIVHIMNQSNNIALVQDYLLEVQHHNLAPVNEAINELLLESGDYDKLRDSITTYTNYDDLRFANKLAEESSIEIRRLAALIYRMNKKFKKSLEVSLADKQHQDAMDTVAVSGSVELAEELLRNFVAADEPNCFVATLYTCYDLIKMDVVVELAWRKGWNNEIMPFIIQAMSDFSNKLEMLNKKLELREKKDEQNKSAANDFVPDVMGSQLLPGMGNLALMPPPTAAPQQPNFHSNFFGNLNMPQAMNMGTSFSPLGNVNSMFNSPTFS